MGSCRDISHIKILHSSGTKTTHQASSVLKSVLSFVHIRILLQTKLPSKLCATLSVGRYFPTIVNNFCCKTISSIQFSKRNSSITAPSLFGIVPFRSSDRHTCSIVRIYCLFDHSSKENTSFLKYILT